ncbi:hypothetical protein Peur_027287 [Populus x canadensis]
MWVTFPIQMRTPYQVQTIGEEEAISPICDYAAVLMNVVITSSSLVLLLKEYGSKFSSDQDKQRGGGD